MNELTKSMNINVKLELQPLELNINKMNEDFSDAKFENQPTTLITSMLFQCNLFRLVPDGTNSAAQCLACKRKGVVRFIKGRTTSNYHFHMKRLHASEYEEYLTIKHTGIPRPIIPIDENFQFDDELFETVPRPSPLFTNGFFEVHMRLPNKIIKANCLTCQSHGRQNLIQGREGSASNLLAHLKRMHLAEYERYVALIPAKSQAHQSSQVEHDTQQSVVSTIKSEDLEFVDVNQDEMPGETWDSFESSDFYDSSFHNQPTHNESTATSTTHMNNMKRELGKDNTTVESSAFNENEIDNDNDNENENADAFSENDETSEWNDQDQEQNSKQSTLLFRGGFFRFLRKEGTIVRAECLSCKQGNEYSGQRWSNSNFLKHMSRRHPKDYERYLAMKEEERLSTCQSRLAKFEQTDFNRIVLDFMINGMHPPSLLEDPSFDTLLNDIATQRTANMPSKKQYHIISPKVLSAEIEEQLTAHKSHLHSTLKDLTSVSTAVDTWSVHRKTFMVAIVNWIDSTDFQRVSNVISCDIFNGAVSNEHFIERLQQIYNEYGISEKIVATVTNNNRQYEKCESINGMVYLPLKSLDYHHIENPTHLFELIGSKEVQRALEDEQYAEYHKSAFAKFDAFFEQLNAGNISEEAKSIVEDIFIHPLIGSKVTDTYNSVSNLVNCDSEFVNRTLNELKIAQFTENDINFFKEYVIILEPIATAIEYLQKNNCYYATLLPMIYSMKDNLMDVKNQGKIQLCQTLLTTILSAVEHKFQYLFEFDNEKCHPALISTCTHPFFKMRWLKGDRKIHTNQILNLLVKVAKEYDDGIKENNINQQPAVDDFEEEPSKKKFKFSFDTTSSEETDDEMMIQMDFMSFLKKPCQNNDNNLEELKQHPWVQKLFIRYNSIISSAAALERSFPLFDIINKSQSGLFDDTMFCKLGLLRGSS